MQSMYITRIKLTNWKNFQNADINLFPRTYVIGANASGKSNLLDVFRFLRDVSNPKGGGLQKAIDERGGLKNIRCLHARRETKVRIEVHLASDPEAEIPDWTYSLAFKPEGVGAQRIFITEEKVMRKGTEKPVIERPSKKDNDDKLRLTQTALEQIQANADFRDVAECFAATTYLHLVPQFLRFGDKIGGNSLESDPFGQGFLKQLAHTTERTRKSRLDKIQAALKAAVPYFDELKFYKDEMGHPHLQARYVHYRPKAGWQKEDQFSDGTLRLIGLLWSLLDGDNLLLLEEPELSLHDGIVEHIPLMIENMQRKSKYRRQVIITTHSQTLLNNKGIDARGVVRLESTDNGTVAALPTLEDLSCIRAGLTVAEVMLPKTRPPHAEQLTLGL
jgi:predicted ATPase